MTCPAVQKSSATFQYPPDRTIYQLLYSIHSFNCLFCYKEHLDSTLHEIAVLLFYAKNIAVRKHWNWSDSEIWVLLIFVDLLTAILMRNQGPPPHKSHCSFQFMGHAGVALFFNIFRKEEALRGIFSLQNWPFFAGFLILSFLLT